MGQYKLKLYSTIKLIGEYQDKSISLRERGTQSQRESISLPINNTPCTSIHKSSTFNAHNEPLNLYGIKTILQYNVDTNKFLGYYKTHFIYEQTPQGTNTKNRSKSGGI